MKMTRFALSLLAAAALAGCSAAVKLDEPAPVETRSMAPVTPTNSTASAQPMAESKVQTVDLGAQLTAAVANQRVVYFDLDSYTVKDEFRGLVEAHAKRLSVDNKVALRLEGHTDERGGTEYNLALGQKRAEAAQRALMVYGVKASQLEAVSWGKEKPKATGHDEASWAQNRRDDFQYPAK